MDNSDIFFGVVLLVAYTVIILPVVGSTINVHSGYRSALKTGAAVHLFILGFGLALFLIVGAVMYFTIELKPDSPASEFIKWVNQL